MSTTASEINLLRESSREQLQGWANGLFKNMTKTWIDDYASMPGFGDKLTLVRTGKKKFIVKRQWGAALVTYKCGYPEAQRRFALLVITRRLTA